MKSEKAIVRATNLLAAVFTGCLLSGLAHGIDGAPAGGFQRCWDRDFSRHLTGRASSDSRSVYVSAEGGTVQAVDSTTGRDIWISELGGSIASNLLATDTSVFLVANQGGHDQEKSSVLRSISKQTGLTNWVRTLALADEFSLGISGGFLIAAASDGRLLAVYPPDGSVKWEAPVGPIAFDPVFSGDRIAAGTRKSEVHILSITDIRGRTTIPTRNIPTAASFVGEKEIIVGDERGHVTQYKVEKRSVGWTFKTGAKVGSITVLEEGILAVSYDNFVYLLSRGGSVIWKRRLRGRAAGPPVISEGTAVFSDISGPTATVIDLKGGKLVNELAIADGGDEAPQPIPVGSFGVAFLASDSLSFYSSTGCSGSERGSR